MAKLAVGKSYFQLHYNCMGPTYYMGAIVDQNIIMQYMTFNVKQ